MNKRHMLFGLIIFVFITTISMIIISGDSRVYRMLHRHPNNDNQGASTSFSSRNIAQLSTPNKPINAANSNSTSSLQTPNGTQEAKTNPQPLIATKSTEKKPQPTNQKTQPTNRPLKCQNCFQPNLANLTTIPEVCAGSGTATTTTTTTSPEILMLITTTLNSDGKERRAAIRETWASVTKNNTAKIRHVFLLGSDKEGKVSEEVVGESARFRDMLVSNFVDVYANLTYKTLAGLAYFVEHCRQAKYFLKTDQDMYVFPEKLLSLAQKNHQTLQTSLGGSCHQSGKPWRDPRTKYYASVQSYPQATYPGFCSGTGYLGSMNVARKILEVSPNVPFFHLEDVYLALVLRSVGFKLSRFQGFVEGSGVCRKGGKGSSVRAKNTMTIHEVSAQKIREMWNQKCGL